MSRKVLVDIDLVVFTMVARDPRRRPWMAPSLELVGSADACRALASGLQDLREQAARYGRGTRRVLLRTPPADAVRGAEAAGGLRYAFYGELVLRLQPEVEGAPVAHAPGRAVMALADARIEVTLDDPRAAVWAQAIGRRTPDALLVERFDDRHVKDGLVERESPGLYVAGARPAWATER